MHGEDRGRIDDRVDLDDIGQFEQPQHARGQGRGAEGQHAEDRAFATPSRRRRNVRLRRRYGGYGGAPYAVPGRAAYAGGGA